MDRIPGEDPGGSTHDSIEQALLSNEAPGIRDLYNHASPTADNAEDPVPGDRCHHLPRDAEALWVGDQCTRARDQNPRQQGQHAHRRGASPAQPVHSRPVGSRRRPGPHVCSPRGPAKGTRRPGRGAPTAPRARLGGSPRPQSRQARPRLLQRFSQTSQDIVATSATLRASPEAAQGSWPRHGRDPSETSDEPPLVDRSQTTLASMTRARRNARNHDVVARPRAAGSDRALRWPAPVATRG